MTVFAGNTFSAAELLSGARKGLYERSRLLSPDDTLQAIQDLKLWVGEELSFEEGASASFGRILSELWHAEYLDQLPPLLNKFERLVSAYFVRRGSVTAFHGFCNAWHEGVLRRVLLFVEEGMELNDPGHPVGGYALLAAGSLGRREQTMEEADRYFLVWTEGDPAYFEQFAYQFIAILDQCGVIAKEGAAAIDRILWRGSLEAWEGLGRVRGEVEVPSLHMEFLSDLRHICGEEAVGREAIRIGRSYLEICRLDAQLPKLARHAVAVPVALNIFGGIRVERSGEHLGCFDLTQSALYPLVNAVRLLAVQHELDPGATLGRLTALGSLEVLEKGLVARLEAAYHLFATLKIGKEIALEHPCLDPAGLTADERHKVKRALEAVRQLQCHVRRALLDKGRKRNAIKQG